MTSLKSILFYVLFFAVQFSVHAQTPAATPTDTTKNKTAFFDKIGHWLTAYIISSDDFMPEKRNDFKSAAFAEVYVDGVLDYDSWMFNLLNRLTQARVLMKQDPHITFGVKFKPTDKNLNEYTVVLTLQGSSEVNVKLDDIIAAVSKKYLNGKKYSEPHQAVGDVENALAEAMNTLAARLGKSLAQDPMVRLQDEIYWNGHTIGLLDSDGNSIELEAIDKDLNPIPYTDITWTNADPAQSKGVVDMTDVPSKTVTLARNGGKSMTVTLKRVKLSFDFNEMLKALIIEALATKKKEAQDSIQKFKKDSVDNVNDAARLIAQIEAANFPLEDDGSVLTPMFNTPLVYPEPAEIEKSTENRWLSFKALKKRKKIQSDIRRKLNVVALADLIVDHPDQVKLLLDELLKNSGKLAALLIESKDGDGQKAAARDIVLDFLNKNLERIAGGHYTQAQSQYPVLTITPAPPTPPAFRADKYVYINPYADFAGKDSLETALNKYMAALDTPTYVFVNYSQDNSRAGYLARGKLGRPKGLQAGAKYKVYTLINMPGSLEADMFGEPQGTEGNTVVEVIDGGVADEKEVAIAQIQSGISDIFENAIVSTECSARGFGRGLRETPNIINGIIAGTTEVLLCLSEEDKCANESDAVKFWYGFANGLIQQLDVLAMRDAGISFLKEQLKNQISCIKNGEFVKFSVTGDISKDANEQIRLILKCFYGVDITPEQMLAFWDDTYSYVSKHYDKPYFQGQAAAFIVTILLPPVVKLVQSGKFAQIVSKFKNISVETIINDLTKGADDLIVLLKGPIKSTYDDLIKAGLKSEIKANSILLKNATGETVAIIYDGKLTPTKWAWQKNFSATDKLATSEGYIIIKDGKEIKFDLGFKEGRKLKAKEVNDYLVKGQGKDLDGQPYWAGTQVDEVVVSKGEIIYFVEDYNSATPNPGQYGSKDPITTIKELREKLAVKEAWKPTANAPTLRTYRVKVDLKTRSGIIGRQSDNGIELTGGGHQYEVIDYLGKDWENYLEPLGSRAGTKLK